MHRKKEKREKICYLYKMFPGTLLFPVLAVGLEVVFKNTGG